MLSSNNRVQNLNNKVGSIKHEQQSAKFEQQSGKFEQPAKHESNNKTQTTKCKHQSETTYS